MASENTVGDILAAAMAAKNGETPPPAPVTTDAAVASAHDAEIAALKAQIEALKAAPPRVAAPEDRGEPGFYKVQLKDCCALIVKAKDRLDAIDAYYKVAGVNGTIHKPSVERVAKPEANAHASGFWMGDGSTPPSTNYPKPPRKKRRVMAEIEDADVGGEG